MTRWPFDPLPLFCADLVVVDVPSDFDTYSAKGEAKGPRAQYDVITDEEIAALPIGDLVGSDAWIFNWATGPKLDLAIEWMKGWGFKYVTNLSWRKVTKNGRRAMGPGYVARSLHEIVLIGKVGNPAYRKPLDSLFDGVRREHSRKPDEFYDRIDRFAPAHYRKLDLFSRQSRPGWTTWGREATKFDAPDLGKIHKPACASVGIGPNLPLIETRSPPMREHQAGLYDEGFEGAPVYGK